MRYGKAIQGTSCIAWAIFRIGMNPVSILWAFDQVPAMTDGSIAFSLASLWP